MALPSKPSRNTPQKAPAGPVQPPQDVKLPPSAPQAPGVVKAPEVGPGKVLGDKDGYRTQRVLGDVSGATSYQTLGSITSEEVINVDYQKVYARLMPQVVEVKDWLQNFITEQNLTEKVGRARRDRGEILQDMKRELDRLLLKRFSTENISQADSSKIASLVLNEILGFGPIEPLWQDKTITEIMVNGPYKIYIERFGKLELAKGVQFRDSDHVLELAQQILGSIGKTLDIAHSYEDGRLQDGSRINATHPVIGPGGPYLTIRRFPEEVFSLRKLVNVGSMTPEMAEELGNLIYHKCSTLISGGTGAGKTSLLNALSGCVPEGDRIITIEDNLELQLHPDRHVVAMESRKSLQAENAVGNVTIRDLVRNSLRQRPTRIVVGEVRDGAAYDMLQAMNTGHEGSMTTLHANSARGAIERLSNLIAQIGELSSNQSLTLISSGVDIIVQILRYEDGSRRVSSISEVPSRVDVDAGGNIVLEPRTIWEFQQTGFDENNMIVGEYAHINDYSDEFKKQHRLDKKRRLPLDEIFALSDLTKTVDEG